MIAKREKVKKGESPPIQDGSNEDEGMKGEVVEQESGESKDVEGEKIAEKDVQDGSVQTKERSNTNEGKKEEGELDEKTKKVRCELEEIVGENWRKKTGGTRKEIYWNDSQKRKG